MKLPSFLSSVTFLPFFLPSFLPSFLSAVLGLRCSAQASHCGGFSYCRARALGAWASVVVARGLSSCGTWALLLQGMWDLSGLGIKPLSPALAGGVLTTAPPGKSQPCFFLTEGMQDHLQDTLICLGHCSTHGGCTVSGEKNKVELTF